MHYDDIKSIHYEYSLQLAHECEGDGATARAQDTSASILSPLALVNAVTVTFVYSTKARPW